MKESHLIIKAAPFKDIPNYYEYTGLGWRVATDLGTEIISHPGGINGFNIFIGINPPPAKQGLSCYAVVTTWM